MRSDNILRACSAVLVVVAGAAGCARPPAPVPPRAAPRAIVLSIDALNEARIRESLPADVLPALHDVFDGGACAAAARPAFPSLTAASHASLWTGSYGDVNGIAGNVQPRLPRDAHRLTETTSGFLASGLRAEPIWVTTALAGVRTAGHHATQSPAPAGYPAASSVELEPALAALRARAAAAAASPALHVVNGYDGPLAGAQVVTQASRTPQPLRDLSRWSGLASHPDADRSVTPRELAVPVGARGDSAFVLFLGRRGAYTHALISGARDARAAVMLRPAAADTTPVRGRALARHFSAPFTLSVGGRTVRMQARLFELAADASRFMLYLPAVAAIAANHDATRAGYEAGAPAWVGNSATGLLWGGAFGPPITGGGDGSAELRWLETAELATQTSIAGAEWMWTALAPQLMLDYFAIGDDTDHAFWGLVSPAAPGHDLVVAQRIQSVRARAWSLVDARVAAVQELARASGATLFLSGDHGMRAYWRIFRPNVALAQAGLLALDAGGTVDLLRTRALSPNGYWVSVNRTAWRSGVVPERDVPAVTDSIVRVLTNVRGVDGRNVVARIYRAAQHDSLGLGGPTGGDVYFELEPGYYYSADRTGPVTSDTPARGGHGYPSVSPDMHTVLCAYGPGFPPGRIGVVRTIDLAPTVLELLGVRPAATVRGRSVLDALLRRRG